MRTLLLYKSLILVPLVYIFFLGMLASYVDVEAITNTFSEGNTRNGENKQKKADLETVDSFLKETDIVFVRSRALVNEMQREKYH